MAAETYMYFKYKKIRHQNPTDDNIIIFESFIGKQYACSPKAIYNYVIKDPRFSEFTFVWAFRSGKLKQIKNEFTDTRTVLVEYKSKNIMNISLKLNIG